MHHDPRRHVLFVAEEPDAVAVRLGRPPDEIRLLLDGALDLLRKARAARPAPFVDRSLYVGWNGMMISAFLDAARGLGEGAAREAALRALDRVVADAYEPGRGFRHIVGGDGTVAGLLDDQVHMARALLDAYEHTGRDRYLGVAADVMDYVLSEFGAPAGAFYDVAGGEARGPQGLAVAYVPVQDTPTPSGNAVAILVLDRLAVLTGRARYGDAAERALRACAPGTTDQGLFAATLALALDLHLEPPLHVVVVGARGDPRTEALHAAALAAYRYGAVAHLYDPADASGGLPAPAAALAGAADSPRAYVCTATACASPATDPRTLEAEIRTFGRPPAA